MRYHALNHFLCCDVHFLFYFVDNRSTPLISLFLPSLFPLPLAFPDTSLLFPITHTSLFKPQLFTYSTAAVAHEPVSHLFTCDFVQPVFGPSVRSTVSLRIRCHQAVTQTPVNLDCCLFHRWFPLNTQLWTGTCPLSSLSFGPAQHQQRHSHQNVSPLPHLFFFFFLASTTELTYLRYTPVYLMACRP